MLSKPTLAVVLTAQFVIPMSIAGTAIALPRIAADLGESPGPLQWVVNGFNLAFALFTVVWGAASDRIGHHISFRIGVAVTSLAGLASAVAPDLLVLDIARIVAGIGAAAVLVGATSILSNLYSGTARATAFAAFGTVNGLGLALGPTIAGLLVGHFGWRWVFFAQAVVLAVACAGTKAIPAVRARTSSGLDLSLLRNRLFLGLCLVPVAGAIGFVTLLTYLPAAMSGIRSTTPGSAGLLMLVMTVPVLVAPAIVARVITSTRVGPLVIIHTSLVALVIGTLGMLLLTPGGSIWWILLPMTLLGLGFGLPIGLVDGEALAAVPAHSSGTAAGVLNLFRIGGEALFVAAYAALLTHLVRGAMPDDARADATAAGVPGFPHEYATAFAHTVTVLVVLLIGVGAAVVALTGRAWSVRRAESVVSEQ
ncbi:MFS transporter [Rhodococcus sp. Eu-32]|uniref:MFS transporter n=1 Tax=Rhodococcus sp. Eu-32 TaxID=1017319 RepID=UPI000DF4A4D8|nr:MFS transporter [Rhodococcus sp. Eu-32]RRQ28311.1 MFS transporter [Rhodococcus sp. Eu-32]